MELPLRYMMLAMLLVMAQAKNPCSFDHFDDEDYSFGYEQEECELTNLEGLNFTDEFILQDRSIKFITDQVLFNLSHVRRVDLSGNILTKLPQAVFYGLENVCEINLKHNHLIVADFSLFTGNSLLESVDLGHNKITKIQPDDGVNITSLRLNNNNLRNVSDLCCLELLEFLDLSGNRALQLTGFKFKCWPNMKTLILADANLKSMRNDYQTAFDGLTKLEVLDITRNGIFNVCTENYPVLPKLVGLYMSHNKMLGLNITQLMEKFQNLSQITIAGNAWSCEYFMDKLHTSITKANLTIMSDEAFCDMASTVIDDDSNYGCSIADDEGSRYYLWFCVGLLGVILVVCLVSFYLRERNRGSFIVLHNIEFKNINSNNIKEL